MKTIPKLLQLLRDNARADASAADLRAEYSENEAHFYLYDAIDAWWGVSAQMLVDALALAGEKTVHLHINSPGGDVFEARAMASAIVAHSQKVIAHIDGLAASAATYVALAANEVRMTEGGMLMIHNSWTMALGNKKDLRDTANLLEKIDGTIVADYARKTSLSLAQIAAWMDSTTWFTAEEAKANGFVDSVDPASRDNKESAQAKALVWNLSAYENAPKIVVPNGDADTQNRVKALRQKNENRLRLLGVSGLS
jgi:ATP-dependent Clp protease, protease subunit